MSYGGEDTNAWDVGPPGAEGDYTSYQQPVAAGSEQWPSSSYSQYPSYNYPAAYGYAQPAYTYDPNYYQGYSGQADYSKYSDPSAYAQYNMYDKNYEQPKRRSRTPIDKRHKRSRSRSLRSSSRSTTPPRRVRKYSRNSSSSSRSRSRSRSTSYRKKSRRASSSKSSHSRGSYRRYSRSPAKKPHKYTSPIRRSPLRKKVDKYEHLPKKGKDRSQEKRVSKTPDSIRNKPDKKHRESSVEIPRSYKVKHRSSSESSSSSSRKSKERSISPTRRKSLRTPSRSRSRHRSSESRSRSSSRKRTTAKRSTSKSRRKRHSSSRSTSPPGLSGSSVERSPEKHIKKTKTKHRSSSKSRSRSSSHSPSAHSSDSSTRGHFDTQDRKKYFKKFNALKEAANKEKDKNKVKEKINPIQEELKKIDEEDIVYKEPSPVKGINFEDLPPPPTHLEKAKGSTNKPPFKNDGSFLEMFKKMQEQAKTTVSVKEEEVKPKTEMKKPLLPFIGKRRGGRILKTGLVKKAKSIEEQLVDNTPKDAWSLYMQEVKKYRETSCEDDRKTRPLVK